MIEISHHKDGYFQTKKKTSLEHRQIPQMKKYYNKH